MIGVVPVRGPESKPLEPDPGNAGVGNDDKPPRRRAFFVPGGFGQIGREGGTPCSPKPSQPANGQVLWR